MIERGAIRHRDYARQLRDFTGVRYGTITPTDIDAFLDFGGKRFVFIEAKHGDAPVLLGQRLALERLCDACQAGDVEALVLVASHNTAGDIDYGALPVREYRYRGQWRVPAAPVTVREAIDRFRGRAEGGTSDA